MSHVKVTSGVLLLLMATAGSACARQVPLAVQATKGSGPYSTSYALASLASSPQNRPERLKNPGDFNLSTRFKVEIDGVQISGIKGIEGLPRASEVVEYKDGDNAIARHRPGRQRPGRILLTQDGSPDSTLQAWRKSVMDGKVDRKSISIVLLNDAGAEAATIHLSGSYPTKWTGPSQSARNSAHATETLDIAYETMEMK